MPPSRLSWLPWSYLSDAGGVEKRFFVCGRVHGVYFRAEPVDAVPARSVSLCAFVVGVRAERVHVGLAADEPEAIDNVLFDAVIAEWQARHG